MTGTEYPSGRVGRKGKRGGTTSEAMQALFRNAAETNAEMNPGPARTGGFSGFGDYPGLKARSNDTYDRENVRLLGDEGSFDNTIALMNNQQSKVSPWAPWFQTLADQGVTRLADEDAAPRGFQSNILDRRRLLGTSDVTRADATSYAPTLGQAQQSAQRYMDEHPAMKSLKRQRY